MARLHQVSSPGGGGSEPSTVSRPHRHLMNYAMLEQQRRMWFFRIYQTRMGERRRSHARKDRWLPEPTQFPVNGQWWSNSATHLGSDVRWWESLLGTCCTRSSVWNAQASGPGRSSKTCPEHLRFQLREEVLLTCGSPPLSSTVRITVAALPS